MKTNREIYLDRMRKSMQEKLFWVDKIQFDECIDFGCADGELLSQLEELNLPHSDRCYRNDYQNIGIDHNEIFLEIAQKKTNKSCFIRTIDELETIPNCASAIKVFNFSSVFHELFTFCSKEEIIHILEVAANNCDYITIRDMLKPSEYGVVLPYDMHGDIYFLPSIFWDKYDYSTQDRDAFKNEWFKNHPLKLDGSDDDLDNIVQFRMKLMYFNNRESEAKEDYFSVDWKFIDEFFTSHGFKLMYKNDYTNPYVAEQVSLPNLITHRQLIYKKSYKEYKR